MVKRKRSASKSGIAEKTVKWTWGKIFKRSFLSFFLIVLGGFLFNIDRMGDVGIKLLMYRDMLPAAVVRFLPGGNAVDAAAVPDEVIRGTVIEVYDGDTVNVLVDNKRYRIRFFGVDAPEKNQEYGIDARDALREKILGRQVEAVIVSTDRYGRAVAKIMLGVRYINLEMVAEGHAWYYEDYASNEFDLKSAEINARRTKAGLWAERDPIPPWSYRRENMR